MYFVYHRNESLPCLAWCAVTNHGESEINIYHGKGVETSDQFFVEGVWDGNFTLGDFNSAFFFMGTGGKIISDTEAVFATPNHVLERLYTISANNATYVSNSLPFILFQSGSTLDEEYLDYEKDFNSILKGLNNYKQMIPLAGNRQMQLHYYCNITVGENEVIAEHRKEAPEPFKNYDQYYKNLMDTLKVFVKNAKSSERNFQYGTVTTVSKGYDAAACAACVRQFGCNTAVTFNDPEKYAKDSGVELARELGYKNIITGSANAYRQNSSLIEAEFVSSGEIGAGIVFSSFENEFAHSVVFLGERGDKIWDKNKTDVNREMRFKDEMFTGTSFTENRLRVGYAIAPLPLFGAENWPEIHKISNSKEMKEYSIGGSYDRPIPRKILEINGIDREKFGMSKSGAGFSYKFDNFNRLKMRMSKKSFQDFYNFYENNRRISLNVLKHWIKYLWAAKYQYLRFLLNKVGIRLRNKPLKDNATSNPGAPSYLFIWGVQKMIKRYENAKMNSSACSN